LGPRWEGGACGPGWLGFSCRRGDCPSGSERGDCASDWFGSWWERGHHCSRSRMRSRALGSVSIRGLADGWSGGLSRGSPGPCRLVSVLSEPPVEGEPGVTAPTLRPVPTSPLTPVALSSFDSVLVPLRMSLPVPECLYPPAPAGPKPSTTTASERPAILKPCVMNT